MPRKLKYSSNIKDKGLLGKELKTAAELYCQGNSYEKIVEPVLTQLAIWAESASVEPLIR